MEYAKLIISIFLVISLLLSGCEFLIDEELNEAVKSGNWENCNSLGKPDDSRVMRCISKIALDKENPELCEKISGGTYKDDCYIELMKTTNRLDLCDKASEDGSKRCWTEAAIDAGQEYMCEKIPEGQARDYCYYQMADAGKGGVSMCAKSSTSSASDSCLLRYSESTGEGGICIQMSSETGQTTCYTNAAKASGNKGYCDIINDDRPLDGGKCYTEIAKLKNDPAICDEISEQAKSIKDNCYYTIGIQAQKATACNQVSDTNKKTQCYLSVASATGEVEVCERVSDPVKKDECVMGAAMTSKDINDCDKINDEQNKLNCISRLTPA
ncbi:hypothetical protein JW868_03880 [Candidatus Woesearchaeota archaeon]|nr:hypothetical protein [Candidatus Woesearchaeota archaeon]